MNLTPEQRAVGQENFYATIGSEFTRRDFLKGSIAAAATGGVGLGAYYFAYQRIGDPVRVGIIGTGDEGSVLIGAHTPEFVRIVALADIRPYNVHRAFHGDSEALAPRPGLMRKYGWSSEDQGRAQVKVYDQDYHDLLNDPNIEGVIIALPLHLHAKVAIEALRAGKHVLTEKLMGHSVRECKEMARVAQETGLLLATGHQRHYSILYDNAVDTIRRGLMGKIHHIRAQWHRQDDSWLAKLPNDDLQKELDDFKVKLLDAQKKKDAVREAQVQLKVDGLTARLMDSILSDSFAAHHGYEEHRVKNHRGEEVYVCSPLEELIRWRLWDRTGGGLMAELGSHQLDASSIFASADFARHYDGAKVKVRPLSVTAIGGRHLYEANRDAEDHVYCTFEFPAPEYFDVEENSGETDPEKRFTVTDKIADPDKKIVVTYSSINGNGFGGYGEVVMGTEGTLILEREQDVYEFAKGGASTSVSVSKSSGGAVLNTADSGSPAAAVAKEALGGGPASRGYTEEIEHWAWCIRNPSPENHPRCHPKVALADAVIALTSNIAMKRGERIEFNPAWFDIDSDETPEGDKPDLSRYA